MYIIFFFNFKIILSVDIFIQGFNNNIISVLQNFLTAAKSWDANTLAKMPHLSYSIGKYAGEQFTPADPMLGNENKINIKFIKIGICPVF